MSAEIIEKRICLECKFLDSNIMDHLLQELKKTCENECSEKYGYILNINKIIKIKDHKIGRANCGNIFIINFEAEILKPDLGNKFIAKVCMIYKDGIFVIIKNKQKMLIPRNNIIKYNFNEHNNTYINKNDNNDTIKINDEIQVIVTASKYNKKNFSCFGSIV